MRGSRLRRIGAGVAAFLLALGVPLATATPAGADGPTSFSNSATIAVPATGSPNQMGDASPYPSPITVSGMTGSVTDVTVTLFGVTHPIFNDIDALLVAPTGQNLMVVSDASNTNTFTTASNVNLTFSDTGGAMPGAGTITAGTYKPTNRDDGKPDVFAGLTVSGQTTFAGAFTGIAPNGSWKLYVHDDTSGDVGQIAGGWSLGVTTSAAAAATGTTVTTSGSPSTTGNAVTFTATVTSGGAPVTEGSVTFSDAGTNLGAAVPLGGAGKATLTTSALAERTHSIVATYGGTSAFLTSNGSVTQVVDNATTVSGSTYCNTGQLTVPTNGPATPYGSHITVSGVAGNATKVTAQLFGVSHQAPIDLDMLLVGPTGVAATLLSDVGGHDPVSGVNLTFDDAAASSVSTTSLASGTFKPTDDDTENNDNFPPPAPSTAAPASLSGFNGVSANGTWTLYVNDDATADSGSISGGWCVTVLSQAATTTALSSSKSPSSVGDSVTFTATVTSAESPVTAGSVVFTVDGSAQPAITVGANGTATFTTSTLTAGSHAVTADYGGTSSYAASTANLSQVVALHPTALTLTADDNPSDVGDPVTFTAAVTSAGSPVTAGSVIFTVDGSAQPAVTVDAAGTATLTSATLTAGTHSIKADYGATSSYAASTDSLDQVVSLLATDLTLTSDTNPADVGDPVTFTATVTSGGNPVTSGAVVLSLDGTAQPEVTVDAAGTATFTTSDLTIGSHTIEADYAATSTYDTSTDSLDQAVAPKASAGASYTVAEGGSVALSAAGSTDNATYEWDLDGDGDYTDATGADPTLTWADLEALGINDGPSTHTISLRVTVGAQTATATATLAVTNTAPTPYTVGTPVATAGSPFTIKVGANDPSSADMAADFTYTIDWGDGSPVQTVVGAADPPMTHTYTAVGTFSATFSVADKDGGDSGAGPGQLQIQVNAAPSTTTSTATTGEATTSTSATGGTTTGATTATSSTATSGTATSGTAASDDTATSSTETSSTLDTPTTSTTGTETVANTSTVTSWTTSTADPGASGGLPNTGVSIGAPLAAGALLLLAGGALLLAGRRPRSRRRH